MDTTRQQSRAARWQLAKQSLQPPQYSYAAPPAGYAYPSPAPYYSASAPSYAYDSTANAVPPNYVNANAPAAAYATPSTAIATSEVRKPRKSTKRTSNSAIAVPSTSFDASATATGTKPRRTKSTTSTYVPANTEPFDSDDTTVNANVQLAAANAQRNREIPTTFPDTAETTLNARQQTFDPSIAKASAGYSTSARAPSNPNNVYNNYAQAYAAIPEAPFSQATSPLAGTAPLIDLPPYGINYATVPTSVPQSTYSNIGTAPSSLFGALPSGTAPITGNANPVFNSSVPSFPPATTEAWDSVPQSSNAPNANSEDELAGTEAFDSSETSEAPEPTNSTVAPANTMSPAGTETFSPDLTNNTPPSSNSVREQVAAPSTPQTRTSAENANARTETRDSGTNNANGANSATYIQKAALQSSALQTPTALKQATSARPLAFWQWSPSFGMMIVLVAIGMYSLYVNQSVDMQAFLTGAAPIVFQSAATVERDIAKYLPIIDLYQAPLDECIKALQTTTSRTPDSTYIDASARTERVAAPSTLPAFWATVEQTKQLGRTQNNGGRCFFATSLSQESNYLLYNNASRTALHPSTALWIPRLVYEAVNFTLQVLNAPEIVDNDVQHTQTFSAAVFSVALRARFGWSKTAAWYVPVASDACPNDPLCQGGAQDKCCHNAIGLVPAFLWRDHADQDCRNPKVPCYACEEDAHAVPLGYVYALDLYSFSNDPRAYALEQLKRQTEQETLQRIAEQDQWFDANVNGYGTTSQFASVDGTGTALPNYDQPLANKDPSRTWMAFMCARNVATFANPYGAGIPPPPLQAPYGAGTEPFEHPSIPPPPPPMPPRPVAGPTYAPPPLQPMPPLEFAPPYAQDAQIPAQTDTFYAQAPAQPDAFYAQTPAHTDAFYAPEMPGPQTMGTLPNNVHPAHHAAQQNGINVNDLYANIPAHTDAFEPATAEPTGMDPTRELRDASAVHTYRSKCIPNQYSIVMWDHQNQQCECHPGYAGPWCQHFVGTCNSSTTHMPCPLNPAHMCTTRCDGNLIVVNTALKIPYDRVKVPYVDMCNQRSSVQGIYGLIEYFGTVNSCDCSCCYTDPVTLIDYCAHK